MIARVLNVGLLPKADGSVVRAEPFGSSGGVLLNKLTAGPSDRAQAVPWADLDIVNSVSGRVAPPGNMSQGQAKQPVKAKQPVAVLLANANPNGIRSDIGWANDVSLGNWGAIDAVNTNVINLLPPKISWSRPTRLAVQELLAGNEKLASIVREGANPKIELPSQIERAVLEHYQTHLEGQQIHNPKFAGINLVREASLLQQGNALGTIPTLAVPDHVREALPPVFYDVVSTVQGQNNLLSSVFKPPHLDESQLEVGFDALPDVQPHLTKKSANMTEYLINLAQNVPMSEATLRLLAGNEKKKIRFEIADTASENVPRPGDVRGLYHLEQDDRLLKVVLNPWVEDMSYMLHFGGVTEAAFYDRADNRQLEYLRGAVVNRMRVLAHAVHDAQQVLGLGLGNKEPGQHELARAQLDETFSAMERGPLISLTPVSAVSEPANAGGKLRTALTGVIQTAELLDEIIASADPAAQALLKAEVDRALSGFSEHMDQPQIDIVAARQRLRDAGFVSDDNEDFFLGAVTVLLYELHDVNNQAKTLQP